MADDQEHVFEKILELALKDKLVLWEDWYVKILIVRMLCSGQYKH